MNTMQTPADIYRYQIVRVYFRVKLFYFYQLRLNQSGLKGVRLLGMIHSGKRMSVYCVHLK